MTCSCVPVQCEHYRARATEYHRPGIPFSPKNAGTGLPREDARTSLGYFAPFFLFLGLLVVLLIFPFSFIFWDFRCGHDVLYFSIFWFFILFGLGLYLFSLRVRDVWWDWGSGTDGRRCMYRYGWKRMIELNGIGFKNYCFFGACSRAMHYNNNYYYYYYFPFIVDYLNYIWCWLCSKIMIYI